MNRATTRPSTQPTLTRSAPSSANTGLLSTTSTKASRAARSLIAAGLWNPRPTYSIASRIPATVAPSRTIGIHIRRRVGTRHLVQGNVRDCEFGDGASDQAAHRGGPVPRQLRSQPSERGPSRTSLGEHCRGQFHRRPHLAERQTPWRRRALRRAAGYGAPPILRITHRRTSAL